MTPAERVVVEAAVRWRERRDITGDGGQSQDLILAVDALLTERTNRPTDAIVEITWSQVVEGDQIYRAANGGPISPSVSGGKWFEVTRSGPLTGTNRVRVNIQGVGRPIQPEAKKSVMVKRGAAGLAVDVLGSVLWSGATAHEVRDVAAALINDPASEES